VPPRRSMHWHPGTSTGKMARRLYSCIRNLLTINKSRRGEMADAPDLKSVVRKGVRVRVPPTAPTFMQMLGFGEGPEGAEACKNSP
jgi:hypothetical protein